MVTGVLYSHDVLSVMCCKGPSMYTHHTIPHTIYKHTCHDHVCVGYECDAKDVGCVLCFNSNRESVRVGVGPQHDCAIIRCTGQSRAIFLPCDSVDTACMASVCHFQLQFVNGVRAEGEDGRVLCACREGVFVCAKSTHSVVETVCAITQHTLYPASRSLKGCSMLNMTTALSATRALSACCLHRDDY